jgi:hypothetical protein
VLVYVYVYVCPVMVRLAVARQAMLMMLHSSRGLARIVHGAEKGAQTSWRASRRQCGSNVDAELWVMACRAAARQAGRQASALENHKGPMADEW